MKDDKFIERIREILKGSECELIKSEIGKFYHLHDITKKRYSYWSSIQEKNMNRVDFFLDLDEEIGFYCYKTLGKDNKEMADRFMDLYNRITIGYRKYKIEDFLKENK